MPQTQQIINIDTQKRIDSYLAEILDIPRNQIQKWIEKGKVCVNGKVVSKNYKLKGEEKISFEPIEFEKPNLKIADCDIKILYEDDFLVVVDKPAGVVVHPGAGSEHKSVVGALLFRGIKLSDIGAPLRPGVVHRIDKDTSGVIVLAKDNNTHFKLANQFALHISKRYYIGICEGHIKDSFGTIKTQIGRHPIKRKQFAVVQGKLAVTHYKVIMRLKDMDIVRFELETGRTHQIRVHMQYLNHPLVGDSVYSKSSKLIQRQALHAFYLGFFHPNSNKFLKFYSKLPKDMIELIG
ncbi:RluA family pseudouridine synthase [Desulfurella sp.]|uniref:RluA family pseudouridine synthase n=1 Tax=Desulfurella sp. TaxID=1962857 RepID=UPI003D0D995F